MEGRRHRNAGTFEGNMAGTPSSTTVSTKLERIAKLACEMPKAALTTLDQHIDIDWLREAVPRQLFLPVVLPHTKPLLKLDRLASHETVTQT